MSSYATIALFAYNRPYHLKLAINYLQKNRGASDSDLVVFCDVPGKLADETNSIAVRSLLKDIQGFRSVKIVIANEHQGLAKSVITGVTEILKEHDQVIVLEDDLLTAPHFLDFMNQGLEMYKNEETVISIHGYSYPTRFKVPSSFFIHGADCWGWATWRRGWNLFEPDGAKLLHELNQRRLTRDFDFDGTFPYTRLLRHQIEGTVDSWAIRWYASAFLRNKLTLYPSQSLIQNIGFDNSGTHGSLTHAYDVTLSQTWTSLIRIDVKEIPAHRKAVAAYFSASRRSLPAILARIAHRIRKIFVK